VDVLGLKQSVVSKDKCLLCKIWAFGG